MFRLLLTALTIALLFNACQSDETKPAEAETTAPAPAAAPAKAVDPAAAAILDRAYEAHGGRRYDKARYGFVFRKKRFEFIHEDGSQIYISDYEKDGRAYSDQFANGQFVRTIDGKKQELNQKDYNSGFEDLNSVIYFATLPFKLRDPAVNLYASGTTTIKGQAYDLLKVNFDEEGGGADHDDNFLYWINQETDRIDYLAYDYKTNDGGVRFRSAYNPRVVDGVLFQDYVNYKAPLGTALADLPALFEQGKLEELSRIETEEVEQLD